MKIIHIAQSHAPAFNNYKPTPKDFNRIVRSQFAVAQLIAENSLCPVVCEFTSENINFNEFSQGGYFVYNNYEINTTKMTNIFPKGLPNNFNDLNVEQKCILYTAGATTVLFLLNKIPILYKSTDPKTAEITERFAQNELRLAFQRPRKSPTDMFRATHHQLLLLRENIAILEAKNAAAAHYVQLEESSKVILVYGSMHDFKPLCDKNGLEYEKIYTHSEQMQLYGKDAPYETFHSTSFPLGRRAVFFKASKLNFVKILKQDFKKENSICEENMMNNPMVTGFSNQ